MSNLYILIGVILLSVVDQTTSGSSSSSTTTTTAVVTPHVLPEYLDINKTKCSFDNKDILISVNVSNPAIPINQIRAVQNISNSITTCSVTRSTDENYHYNITRCKKDTFIDVYFIENIHHIFGGKHTRHFKIECKGLSPTGKIIKVTMKSPEGVTDIAATKEPVTAKLDIQMVVTVFNKTSPSPSVSNFVIGQKYKLWIKGPSHVFMYPTECTATSSQSDPSDSYKLLTNSCAQDTTVLDDFNPVINTTHEGNLYAALYGFRFVNSKEVVLSCSIKVCPSLYCGTGEYLKKHNKDGQCENLKKRRRRKRSAMKMISLENHSRLRRDVINSRETMPTIHKVRTTLHVVDTPSDISRSRKLYDIHSAMLLPVAVLYTVARYYL